MYKALHTQTGEEILILSPQWRKQIARLREMDRQDLLVCQGCRQPLRVKSGEMKRAHFAHKHLVACSFGMESQEILLARAVLYQWLEKQLGDAVTVEKVLDNANLPRPIDCWVESGGMAHAYWLIESGIKLEPREALLSAFQRPDVKVHWIFLQKMLNEEKKELYSLLLTPTERAFLYHSPFDEMEAGIGDPGFSGHYLDAENESITSYRNLKLIHKPNWFQGIKRFSKMDDARINLRDGEILHPGEAERFKNYQHRQMRIASKLDQFQKQEEDRMRHIPRQDPQPRYAEKRNFAVSPDSLKELPCVECGQWTTDYWSTFVDDTGRRVCRCRECLERESGVSRTGEA